MDEETRNLAYSHNNLLEMYKGRFSIELEVRRAKEEKVDKSLLKHLHRFARKNERESENYNLPQKDKNRIKLYAYELGVGCLESQIIDAELIFGECMDCKYLDGNRKEPGSVTHFCDRHKIMIFEMGECCEHERMDYKNLSAADAKAIEKFRKERKRELEFAKQILKDAVQNKYS